MGKKIPMYQILLSIAFLLVGIYFTVLVWDGYIHFAILSAGILAAGFSILNGYKWKYIESGILAAINRAMQAMLILFTVGLLVASWIAGGIVPTMIYYGLQILNPSIFLVASCLICCVVSLATGSSWTTAGTVGVALIGVGMGLDIPLGMVAGAIVSGAYFGDKMSPLSDTTNLAPAIAGTNLFDHIRHMMYTVTPSLIIALVVYAILGMQHAGKELDTVTIQMLLDGISSNYNVSLLMLIPPLLVILMVAFRIPALPGLIGGTALGVIFALIFQGASLAEFTWVLYDGWVSETGIVELDDLLTRGGFSSMFYTISLILCAMTFGGIMDITDQLKSLAEAMLKVAKNVGSLTLTTIISCIFVNIIASDQYLAIILPGRMYKEAWEDQKLKGKNLSRCLEDSATITSPLVPWNTCGTTMASVLGVSTYAYAPYAILNLVNPLVSIFYGFTGITMEKMSDEEYEALLAQRKIDKEIAEKSLTE